MAQHMILNAISTLAFLFVCFVMVTLFGAQFIYVFCVYIAFLIWILLSMLISSVMLLLLG